MPTTHTLKCWPAYFQAIRRKEKNFTVRRDDRGFQKGDVVIFREYDRGQYEITGGFRCKHLFLNLTTGGDVFIYEYRQQRLTLLRR